MYASEDLMVYSLLFLLILPSIAGVFLENRNWWYDAIIYGRHSIDSYQSLYSGSLNTWFGSMFTRYSQKPPLLIWIGQCFVPLGVFLGPVRKGLLFTPIVLSFLTVFISYIAFKRMFDDKLIALAGAVFISSSPMFIGLSTCFYTEPLLLLVVAWFTYVYASHLSWDRYYALLHLLSVFFVSLLTKFSGPFYLILPSIIILHYVFRRGFFWFFMELRQTAAKHTGMAAVTTALFLVTTGLYLQNISNYVFHAEKSLSGKWVLQQTFVESTARLLRASAGVFFLDYSLLSFLIIALAGLFLLRKTGGVGENHHVVVFPLQILLVLLVIGYFQLKDPWRFVFPVLPYVAAIMCWSLRIIGRKTVTILAIVVFLFQAVLLHSYAFGILQSRHSNPFLTDIFVRPYLTKYSQPEVISDYYRLLDVLCNRSTQDTVLMIPGKNEGIGIVRNALILYSNSEYSDNCQFIDYPRKNENYLARAANGTDHLAVIYESYADPNEKKNRPLFDEFKSCRLMNLDGYKNIRSISENITIKLC